MKKNPYANTPFEEQPRPDVPSLKAKLVEKLPSGVPQTDAAPVVTVVTAVFSAIKAGRKEELIQCLDSVQAQTGVALEHLIIDGASKDGTVELIENYQNKTFPIRYLSEPDAGIYDAMNRGLWLARGKFVIFLNSDDFYSNPAGLADSVKALEESGADFSYAPIRVLDEKTGEEVEHLLNHPDPNIIFLEMPFSHQSIMLRREAMREIGGFDLRYSSGADYDSVLRLIFTGHRACFVPTVFVAFRLGGFSFVNMGQSQREVGTMFSRLYPKYLGVELTAEEGVKIYLTKQCSKELRKRQFSFAKAAFGNAVAEGHGREECLVPEKLLMLQCRLQTIKNHPGFWATLRILAKMTFSTPLLFGRFLAKYLRFRHSLGKNEAGKQAFLDLLREEQKKQRAKVAAMQLNQPPQCSTPPRFEITCQDFWCVTGLFAAEAWGAWTSKKFSVFFNLPESYVHQTLIAEIQIGGYVFPDSPSRTVEIIVNGRKITDMKIDNFMPQPHEITIPGDVIASAELDVDFIADQAFSPKALGNGEDTRELALTFRKFSIRREAGAFDPAEQPEIKVGFLNHFNKWWVGGITYFKNLFQAMATTESPRLRPYIFPSPDKLADCLLPYVSAIPVPPPDAASQEHLPSAADYQVDVLSHLNGNQVSEGRDGIAWIADFQHVHLPEMFSEQEIAFRNHSFHTLIDQNRIVCLSSFDAMEDFLHYAPEAAHKARCLHFVSIPEPELYPLPAKEVAEIRKNRKLPERYFYVPNQFWKHKNHIAVLKAIAILKKAGTAVHVVFSGNQLDARFPHYFEELEAFCKAENIEENVHFLGLIPLREVYFLMHDCIALINPSRFEGWSSSVEEAKSIGKTILLSNLAVHYEQMPPHGSYFPCDDPAWLADLMKRAWSELPAGPDLAMEAKAKAALPLRIQQFGKDFQAIVLDAMGNRAAAESETKVAPQITVVTVLPAQLKTDEQEALLRNLQSVAAQQGVSAEHLLVSGDDEKNLNFLQPYLEKYHCKIVTEVVHNAFEARNRGAIAAQGKFVTFLDFDAYYAAEDYLCKAVAALENADADFAGAVAPDFTGIPFAAPSMLFRRKALYAVAGYLDTYELAGDCDLAFRLLLAEKRGVQVDGSGVCAPAQKPIDGEAFQRECGEIFARLSAKAGAAITPEAGARAFAEKRFPAALQRALERFSQPGKAE